MERLELQQLTDAGYTFQHTWKVVDQFEKDSQVF
jgi:hypothetical protein